MTLRAGPDDADARGGHRPGFCGVALRRPARGCQPDLRLPLVAGQIKMVSREGRRGRKAPEAAERRPWPRGVDILAPKRQSSMLLRTPLPASGSTASGKDTTPWLKVMARLAAEITDLGDKIVALTVAKAVELGDYLEEKCTRSSRPPVAWSWPRAGRGPPPRRSLPRRPSSRSSSTARRGQEDQRHQGGARNHRPGPEGSQGPGRRRPKAVKENISKDEAEAIKKKLEDGAGLSAFLVSEHKAGTPAPQT